MGCTHSDHSQNGDVQSFRVYNVNEHGEDVHRGIIKICDGDLVFYQKGKEPWRWPLRCLRRYGYDEELFSIESGRRCAMGCGIYAFKCSRARDLFTLVQDSIQRAEELAQQQHNNNTAGLNGGGSLQRMSRQSDPTTQAAQRPMQTSVALPQASSRNPPVVVNGSFGDYNNSSQLYVNGTIVQSSGHEYTNTGALHPNNSGAFQIDEAAAFVDFLHNPPGLGINQSQVNYAELCMPDSQSSSNPNSPDAELHCPIPSVADQRSSCLIDSANRFSQHGVGGPNSDAHLFPAHEDYMIGASHEDSHYSHAVHQSGSAEAVAEDAVSTNYVNISVEGSVGAACAVTTVPTGPFLPQISHHASHPASSTSSMTISATHPHPSLPLPSLSAGLYPPSNEDATNYCNMALQPPPAPKAIKQVNYILIDHKNQTGELAGGGAGNNSPISPTGPPESPSRKTESYATIDFDRTQALSNATKPVEDDEGGRKTRHNSTIEGIP